MGHGNELKVAVMGAPLASVNLSYDHPVCSGPLTSLSVITPESYFGKEQPLPGRGTQEEPGCGELVHHRHPLQLVLDSDACCHHHRFDGRLELRGVRVFTASCTASVAEWGQKPGLLGSPSCFSLFHTTSY